MIIYLAYFGCLILFGNVAIFFKGFSENGKAFKVFTIYLLLVFLIQIISNTYQYFHVNNLFISHFYFLIQFSILSAFYYNLFKNETQRKIVRVASAVCLSVLSIQFFAYPNIFYEFNLFEVFITSFLLIIYSAFHLYNQLDSKKEFYYLNLGVLIYLFGSTVFFLAGNLITKFNSEWGKIPWILNSLLYIVYQLFILYEWKVSFSNNKKKSL